MKLIRPTALAALLLSTVAAQATTIVNHTLSFDTGVVSFRTTPVDLSLPRFDSSLGTLDAVTLTLFGHVEGFAKAENTNTGARDVQLNLQATLKLVEPVSGNTLIQTTPLVSNKFSATTYDGMKDYGGSSGRTFDNLGADQSTTLSFTDPVTLALFTGSGSLATKASAKAQSAYVGSGNVSTEFRTLSSGYANVTYAYHTSAVPEPGTWALMFAGLGMVGLLCSRRRAA